MHHIMNNKAGAFVSALLHTVKYGKPCRFVTDGNVVLKNMRNTYGIEMDDFSVLDANQHKEIEMSNETEITIKTGRHRICGYVGDREVMSMMTHHRQQFMRQVLDAAAKA